MEKTDYVIKLDLDCNELEFKDYINRFKIVLHIIGFIKLEDINVMQTKKGFHVYLAIESKKVVLLPSDLVCLQSLMGSDYKRECFNFLRVKSGLVLDDSWNVLFNRKWGFKDGQKTLLSQENRRMDLEKLFYE